MDIDTWPDTNMSTDTNTVMDMGMYTAMDMDGQEYGHDHGHGHGHGRGYGHEHGHEHGHKHPYGHGYVHGHGHRLGTEMHIVLSPKWSMSGMKLWQSANIRYRFTVLPFYQDLLYDKFRKSTQLKLILLNFEDGVP